MCVLIIATAVFSIFFGSYNWSVPVTMLTSFLSLIFGENFCQEILAHRKNSK